MTYAYNDAGQMTRRRDGMGQEKRMVYGVAGRLMRVEYARSLGGTAEEVHVYHYDVAAPNSPINNPSNLAGKLAWVEGPVNAEHFSYDALDRMTAHAMVLWDGKSPLTNQTRNSYIEQMTYNAASEVTGKHLPGGFDLSFDYNARGLVERVRGGFQGENRTILASGAFDAQGRVLELNHGNATKACQEYDERGRLLGSLVGEAAQTQCTQVGKTGLGLQHLTFQWGYDGTLAGLTDLSAPTPNARRLGGSFQYDRIAQLIAANTEQGVYEYGYDTIQNLITRETTLIGGALQSELLEYGSAGGDGGSTGPNRVTKIGDKSYPYDAIGNLKQYNGFELSYDVDGRLIKAEKPGQKTLRYYYDAFGDRRALTVEQPGKAIEVYLYPFAEFELRKGIEVFRVDNAISTLEVTRGPGIEIDAYLLDELTSYAANPVGKAKPLPDEYMDLNRDGKAFDAADLQVAFAAYWNDELAGGARTVWRYQQHDQIGSTTSTLDSRGDLVGASRYHPYGEVAERQGVKSTRGFAGSEVDPEEDLGLIRMGTRYYAPGLGRWITPDRFIGEQPSRMRDHPLEANLYSYSKNSPVALKDPDGQFAQWALGFVLGGVVEFGMQAWQGKEISLGKIAIAAVFGAASGGASAFIGKQVVGATLGAMGTRAAANTVAGAGLGGLQEAANQTWGGDRKDDAKMGRAVSVGALGGFLGSVVGEAIDAAEERPPIVCLSAWTSCRPSSESPSTGRPTSRARCHALHN